MSIALRCRCGGLQGSIDIDQASGRAVCYCKDCQAYARFLGKESEVLDDKGGTEIVAALPSSFHISSGAERLACVSLKRRGILRWYATCCKTPIGNTPRDPKMSYLGVVTACLPDSEQALTQRLGVVSCVANADSARGPVDKRPVASALAIARIGMMIIGARLTGKYKNNPFFNPDSSTPVVTPHVLSEEERRPLYEAQTN